MKAPLSSQKQIYLDSKAPTAYHHQTSLEIQTVPVEVTDEVSFLSTVKISLFSTKKNFLLGGSRSMEFNTPDLDDVKESVKQGVTKVAGRISSLATNVMSSIQDKYGY